MRWESAGELLEAGRRQAGFQRVQLRCYLLQEALPDYQVQRVLRIQPRVGYFKCRFQGLASEFRGWDVATIVGTGSFCLSQPPGSSQGSGG